MSQRIKTPEEVARAKKIKEAVKQLDYATNSTLVGPSEVAEGFWALHPYLLNQLLVGLMKLLYEKKKGAGGYEDGRVLPQLYKAAEEIWG